MRDGHIASVRTAMHSLVDRLKPQEAFGVAVFEDQALVHVPARRMRQHDTQVVRQLIEAIEVGGTKDLSAGYLLGLSEARCHVGSPPTPEPTGSPPHQVVPRKAVRIRWCRSIPLYPTPKTCGQEEPRESCHL